jgi:hypothetical protein
VAKPAQGEPAPESLTRPVLHSCCPPWAARRESREGAPTVLFT